MLTNLIVFRTHRIGFSNIIPAILMAALGDRAYKPCKYNVLDSGHLNLTLGEFALNFPVSDPTNHLRYADWEDNPVFRAYLEKTLEQLMNQNKVLAFGSHRLGSIDFLNIQYCDNITVASTYYDEDLYDFLILTLADYHTHMLNNNLCIPTDHDKKLLETLSRSDLVNHYAAVFKSMELIARSSAPIGVSINLKDVAKPSAVETFLNKIGLEFSKEAKQLHTQWVNSYPLMPDA